MCLLPLHITFFSEFLYIGTESWKGKYYNNEFELFKLPGMHYQWAFLKFWDLVIF